MEKVIQQFLRAGNTTITNLLLHNYRRIGMNEQEFVLFLQLESELQAGNDFPPIEKIAANMQCQTTEIYQLLHRLFEKKLLEIKTTTDSQGKKRDAYRFDLLYEKLFALERQKLQQQTASEVQANQTQVFQAIEQEFGRTLSPIELETIEQWFSEDHYSPNLVMLALREAVLSQAYSLKYIDRVLLSWERQNIRTAADVQRMKTKQRQFGVQKKLKDFSQSKNKPKIPLKKWSPTDQNLTQRKDD
ncbi:DnaD domain-containing protein [Liquorilactobacillus sicerae]|uniref:DnaD domain-containing protein n=1 Tax=Liquorilactobacillus sicerae TaxID=1416943 RepID=UPI0024801A78|nr:DnaD domain protein [Liquorilactobacillus sicerae]